MLVGWWLCVGLATGQDREKGGGGCTEASRKLGGLKQGLRRGGRAVSGRFLTKHPHLLAKTKRASNATEATPPPMSS